MNRPEYVIPPNTPLWLAKTLSVASTHKWVYIDVRGNAFWLNEGHAKAIHAKHGGQLFPPNPAPTVANPFAN